MLLVPSNKKLNFTRKGVLIPTKDSDEDKEVLERSADDVATDDVAGQRAAGSTGAVASSEKLASPDVSDYHPVTCGAG